MGNELSEGFLFDVADVVFFQKSQRQCWAHAMRLPQCENHIKQSSSFTLSAFCSGNFFTILWWIIRGASDVLFLTVYSNNLYYRSVHKVFANFTVREVISQPKNSLFFLQTEKLGTLFAQVCWWNQSMQNLLHNIKISTGSNVLDRTI